MVSHQLQEQCDLGQQELMRTNYLEAEKVLAEAERQAWRQRDFDTLSRLYMPLQEARRQIRQRCGEGEVCLDLCAESETDRIDGRHVVENYPHGQVLVAGWGSIEPAKQVRRRQQQFGLYLETFLAAVYPLPAGRVVVIVPLESDKLPAAEVRPVEELPPLLPPHCLVFRDVELPHGVRTGTAQTYAEVMMLWERLHGPFLAEAEAETDPLRRLEAYRKAMQVDYACELAHQKASDVARYLVRNPPVEEEEEEGDEGAGTEPT